MKLIIALACLGASLSLATHALADGRTTATLQQPVAAKTTFWDPLESTCRHASLSIL